MLWSRSRSDCKDPPVGKRIINLRLSLPHMEHSHSALMHDPTRDGIQPPLQACERPPLTLLRIKHLRAKHRLPIHIIPAPDHNAPLVHHTCEVSPGGDHVRNRTPLPLHRIERPPLCRCGWPFLLLAHPTEDVELTVAPDGSEVGEVGDGGWQRREECPLVANGVVCLPYFGGCFRADVEPGLLGAEIFANVEKVCGSEGGSPGFANELEGGEIGEWQSG